jgi:hypothetical protein
MLTTETADTVGRLPFRMQTKTYRTGIEAGAAERIVSATRTGLGDTLRSVVYFTPSAFDILYVRQDCHESEATARKAKSALVDMERVGFAEAPIRTTVAERDHQPSIGPYRFTVRFHEDGFVVRLMEGDAGVLLTVDNMDVNAFEEVATAVHRVLTG